MRHHERARPSTLPVIHHIPSKCRSDTLLAVSMKKTVTQFHPAVRLRFSPAQIAVLSPALQKLVKSFRQHQKHGTSPFTYPFRIYPPNKEFDRGTYNHDCMEKMIKLAETLRTNRNKRRWMEIDTVQLRAAAFAIRSHLDFVRLLRRQQRRKSHEVKARLHIDDKSFAQLKARAKHGLRLLERHMKRANRALLKAVGKEPYAALMASWKSHLRWMRLHIAYYKPLGKPVHGLRKRQQRDLDDLMQMAKRGLRNAGYQPPDNKELRRLMRLYARYARLGRQGNWTVHFLLGEKAGFSRTYHLAHFVIDRTKLKELAKS